jgi:hypothetical protein
VLLPAIGEACRGRVAAYIFVDASIPRDGASRLDLFGDEDAVRHFREAATDDLLPTWTEDDLRDAIPDPDLRRRFVEELRPLPLAVYEEPIPVFEGWPDAPCAYLSFTPTSAYKDAVALARRQGWAYTKLAGGHFHMLVDPPAVADALLGFARQLRAQ